MADTETLDSNAPVCIKVCRDGPRGWHWIALAHFDPAVHRIYPPRDEEPAPVVKRRVGRPRKHEPKPMTEAINGNC